VARLAAALDAARLEVLALRRQAPQGDRGTQSGAPAGGSDDSDPERTRSARSRPCCIA
jgi:hypothetical protein